MTDTNLPAPVPGGEFLFYQTEDGGTRLQVRVAGETVWLPQAQMAELFQTSKQNIGQHVANILAEGELAEISVVKEFFTTAADGKKYQTRFYNLDMIISVGYRITSHVATRFRQWATQRLREYIVKGFTMDDERLKQAGGGNYFDELLARIRDIRSAEKVFWRKVLELYATSIDYDPGTEASQRFFATVQNKMHWAAHGHTAAEIIAERADAARPNMGLTSWAGSRPRKTDVMVAKNYLTAKELDELNLIVSMYLDFAELQARRRKPMYMSDWIGKLDDFMRAGGQEILTDAGTVSHELAAAKAEAEFEQYRTRQLAEPSPVEKDFEQAMERVKKLPPPAKRKSKP